MAQLPAGTIHICPMHPEVRQDHPGNCPKCGMTLEPVMPSLEEDTTELDDFRRRFWWTLPLTVIVSSGDEPEFRVGDRQRAAAARTQGVSYPLRIEIGDPRCRA